MFLSPISSMVLETIVVVLTLGFTPAQSALRAGALAPLSLCVGHCLSTTLEYFVRTPWALLAGGYSVMLLFHLIDIDLLSRWEFPKPSRAVTLTGSEHMSSRGTSDSTRTARLRYGVSACFNARCIGTPEQVRNIPKPLNQKRAAFLHEAARFVTLSYISLDVLGSMGDPEVGSRFLVASRVPFFRRLSDITAEDMVIRVFSAAPSGVRLVCNQGGFYILFAFPQAWPSFYGSLSEAYSIRRLWSRVWHQSITHKFRAIARFVAEDVLGLPPNALVRQYGHILVYVFMSACAVLLLSDMVSRAERVSEFLWNEGLLAWSLPAHVYPMLYRFSMGLNDSVVLVSNSWFSWRDDI
ncbi:hypothetical protein BO82DRAFT_383447 [Aspergillus uvarum CBS 121591]|uniref:Wax synthase domain-containing protein n=1 Tax=Aspergillus uvarum CBS 121591 TaxID=1448315 RepID=A0A319D1W8_9EURO|nr:hypothetical protein BO82DRAFT_383447 [Aspergillus uvarum CBS 121591]PYH81888.1 hypothetical protein BO82DRAFT_383447 [Aspergillus uvarum CBS 121591]